MSCQALRNVPESKLSIELNNLNIQDEKKKMVMKKALHRYYEANIPVKYWLLDMSKDFSGDPNLLDYYNTIDISKMFEKGISICFAGKFGTGKSLTASNILKRALEKGYSGLYVNLVDIISIMKTYDSFAARKELITTDFLVVDELDPRHMASDASADFHGRIMEDILRNRTQNKLPIIVCTNSVDPVSSFSGSIKEGISSLWNYVDVVPVMGKDFRKTEGTK